MLGGLAFVWLLVKGMLNIANPPTRVTVPGTHTIELPKAGRYLIFHEQQSETGDDGFSFSY